MSIDRRHPKALPYLFLTEMWERLGFYVVQGMLVLYMTKAYGFSDEKSFTILGMFTALAYIAPMIGGYLADAFLGFKVAILWGGIFLIIGYAMLALASWSEGFYLSLATIIVGTGLFKPNISSLLGALYKPGDTGRDSGFTIFYIGINVGILLAGIGSGIIKDYFGWHASFALASVGLIIGLCTFAIGLKWGDMKYKTHPILSEPKKMFLRKPWLIFYCILAIVLISTLLQSSLLGDWLLPAVGVILLIFVTKLTLRQEQNNRKRLLMLNVLIISSIVFWTIYWQMFFSVNLFIDRWINKSLFGFQIPTTAFYTLEAFFIILLGAPLAWSWHKLSLSNRNPSPMTKFIIAIIFIGLAFLVLTLSTYFHNEASYLINPLWIVGSYFLITVGEMLLSPIGLSAVTMLSPPHLTGMMMGIWFVALGFGGQFAGGLAKLSSISGPTAPLTQLIIYRHAFLIYAVLAFGVVILLFFMQLILKKILENAVFNEPIAMETVDSN